jgi:hypothetical protein
MRLWKWTIWMGLCLGYMSGEAQAYPVRFRILSTKRISHELFALAAKTIVIRNPHGLIKLVALEPDTQSFIKLTGIAPSVSRVGPDAPVGNLIVKENHADRVEISVEFEGWVPAAERKAAVSVQVPADLLAHGAVITESGDIEISGFSTGPQSPRTMLALTDSGKIVTVGNEAAGGIYLVGQPQVKVIASQETPGTPRHLFVRPGGKRCSEIAETEARGNVLPPRAIQHLETIFGPLGL